MTRYAFTGTVTRDSLWDWILGKTEAPEITEAKLAQEEGQDQVMGADTGGGCRVCPCREHVSVFPLWRVLPEGGSLRRPLAVHESVPPRLVSRPEELGL